MTKHEQLISIYRSMTNEQRQEEIDSVFDIIFALLEVEECDSIESFPNPSIKLKFSCEVIPDESRYYC